MIDELRYTGGFWKEQRRRHLENSLRHSWIIKKELDELNETESKKSDELKPSESEEMITQY